MAKKTVTYEQRMVGREIRKKKVIDEQIHQQPVTEITLTGVEGKAVSPLDFGIELDENGVPTEYSKLLTNQVAAGYNVEGGARGRFRSGIIGRICCGGIREKSRMEPKCILPAQITALYTVLLWQPIPEWV